MKKKFGKVYKLKEPKKISSESTSNSNNKTGLLRILTSLSFHKISKTIILKSPKLLMNEQSEFSKTGGIHASSLIDKNGNVIATREDVGRHNALDKPIGHVHKHKLIDNHSQFIACSGRLNFELVQKGLMSNIGLMAGVGAPTSLAIDLAKRFDMTLLGFVKSNSFNIYTNKERVILGD